MPTPSISEDGNYIWNGAEWLPYLGSIELDPPDNNDFNEKFELNQNSKDILETKLDLSFLPDVSNQLDLPVEDLPFFENLTLEVEELKKDNLVVSSDIMENRIGHQIGDILEVFIQSMVLTFLSSIVILISMFVYLEISSQSSIAITTLTITDDNGLDIAAVYEFYPDKTEVSAEACNIIYCSSDRVVVVQEPIPDLFCQSKNSTINGLDCAGKFERGIEYDLFLIYTIFSSFALFYFGNYQSIIQEKELEVSISKVWSLLVGMSVIYIGLRNFLNYIRHAEDILSLNAVILNPNMLVETQTFPNIIPELIMLAICIIVFIPKDD